MADDPEQAFRDALGRAQAGDLGALGIVWERYQPSLLRFLRGRGATEPADLASAVWIEVARGLRRFRGGSEDFAKWLFTIARRRHIDEIRRAVRRRHVPLETEVAAEPVGDVSDLDRALSLIRRLPDDQRDAVLLRYLRDMSNEQIADVLGVSAGNARVLVHRGLKRLQEMIGAGR